MAGVKDTSLQASSLPLETHHSHGPPQHASTTPMWPRHLALSHYGAPSLVPMFKSHILNVAFKSTMVCTPIHAVGAPAAGSSQPSRF